MLTPQANKFNSRINNVPLAVMYMLLAVTLYASQDIIVKLLPTQISVIQICFFRSVFSFIPIAIMCCFENEKRFFKTERKALHLCRALASTLALLCFVAAFRLIPLADAYAITFSCPFFLAILCGPILKEKVSPQRWAAVIIGFIGVLIVMRPGQDSLQLGGFIALMGGFFYAISLVLIRYLSDQDNNTMIILTFNILNMIICGMLLPFNWVDFEWQILPYFVSIGILGGSAQYAMTQAFRTGPVSAIAPFDYISLLFAVTAGYVIWQDIPDALVIIGSLLIVGAGIYIIKHEQQKSCAY